jgi:heme exporter protein CcmD
MEGYFVYVAAAWGVSALVLAGLVADSLLRARRWRRRAAERDAEPRP